MKTTFLDKAETLLSVEVPKDSVKEKISGTGWICYKTSLSGNWKVLSQPNEDYRGYKILGYVDKDTISFDPSQYVESKEITSYDFNGLISYDIYRDYTTTERDWNLSCDQCFNPDKSFRSLLQSKGQYFVNPYGEKPIWMDKIDDLPIEDLCYAASWQEAESKVITGKLIILHKI